MKIIAKTAIDVVESMGWYIPDEDRIFGNIEIHNIEIHIDTDTRRVRVIADHPDEGVGPIDLGWDMDYTSTLEDLIVMVSEGRVEWITYEDTNRILT